MKAPLPLVALTGVVALTMLGLISDASSLRWAVSVSIRRRLLVRDIDARVGELDVRLAEIVGSYAEVASPLNLSQIELLSSVLRAMEEAIEALIGRTYPCQSQWSLENRTDAKSISYVITLELVVSMPSDGIEAESSLVYVLTISVQDEPGEVPLVVIPDRILGESGRFCYLAE